MGYRQAVITGFGTPSVLRLRHEDSVATPKHGEASIRVEASSMVFTDTLIRKGIYPYLHDAPPFTLGYDFVGTIDALGPGTAPFKIGDRVADVTKIGSNADYIVRPISSLIPVPAQIDPVQAETFLLSGMTAYQLLHRIAQVKPGQRILVLGGTGAVGNALVQLGLIHGLQVVTTASTDNLSMLRALGADAIDYRAPNLDQQLRKFAGEGFQAAFDGIGLNSFRRSFRLLAPEGVLIPYGFVTAARAAATKTAVGTLIGNLMFAVTRAQFSLWNRLPGNRAVREYDLVSYRQENPQAYADDIQQMFMLLGTGQIHPLIHRTYSLDQIQQAHTTLERGGVRGRIVITHQ